MRAFAPLPTLALLLAASGLAFCCPSYAQQPADQPEFLSLTGDLAVHDPVVIKEGDVYYLFCTGGGRRAGGIIPVRTSRDMRTWQTAGFALDRLPAWAADEVPRARNAWAPDISFFNGRYQLYYSLSSFGVNTSAIGLATNKTLDPKSPDYEWQDEGLVVRSRDEDDFNAIDPNFVVEDENNVWLTLGQLLGRHHDAPA